MNKKQQELYEKLLKKVNEYCLGAAAEDVIEAIDNLVESYETKISAYEMFFNGFTYYFNGKAFTLTDVLNSLKALEILKKYITIEETGEDLFPYSINENQYVSSLRPDNAVTKEEYELLKEILK